MCLEMFEGNQRKRLKMLFFSSGCELVRGWFFLSPLAADNDVLLQKCDKHKGEV